MQHMDGVEATKKIKQQWPHIRILILPLFRIPNRRWNRFATVQMVLLKSIETLELANTIRLIHKGGTLIDQECLTKYLKSLMRKRDTTIKSNRL